LTENNRRIKIAVKFVTGCSIDQSKEGCKDDC